MLFKILFLFSLYCASFTVLSANLKQVLCSYNDGKCLTDATNAIFPIIVAGRPGEVEASDPVLLDEIAIVKPNFKLIFSKAYLTGLSGCTVKDVVATPEKTYFEYHIWCPSITYGATFEADGDFNGTPFEGKGTAAITSNNYDIWIKGYYDKYNDEAGDLHTQITDFVLELSPKEVVRNVIGMCYAGQKSTDEAVLDKAEQMELHVRQPIMYKFIQKYVNNINTFLKIVPIKDIHYQMVAK